MIHNFSLTRPPTMHNRRRNASGNIHLRLTIFIFFLVSSVSFQFGRQISRAVSGYISAAMTSDQTIDNSLTLAQRVTQAVESHKNGLVDEAIVGYEDVLPELTGPLASLLHGNVGAIYMNRGEDSRASYHFELAVSSSPSSAKANFNYAVMLTSKLDLHMKAKKYCENALEIDPTMYQALHLMGNILQNLGDDEEAQVYFELAEKQALELSDQTASTEAEKSDDSGVDESKAGWSRFEIMNAQIGDRFAMGSLDLGSTSVQDDSTNEYQLICISERPLIFRIPQLIKDDEVEHILGRAAGRLQKSYVMGGEADVSDSISSQESTEKKDEQEGTEESKKYRSSQNTWLHPDDLTVVIQRRLASLTKFPLQLFLQRSDELQVVKYEYGGQFKVHHDSSAFHPRLLTALFYLTTVPEYMGGETWFPYAGKRRDFDLSINDAITNALQMRSSSSSLSTATCTELVDGTCLDNIDQKQGLFMRPVKGDAVLFFNHLPSGVLDAAAVHAGLPIINKISETADTGNLQSVEKWIANYWVEQNFEMLFNEQ